MADKALYQLPTALSATTTDLVYLEAVNAQLQEGYETKNIQAVTLAKAMLNNFTFETELTETTAKTIIGALNEIAAGGGGGGGSTVYTGTTDPSSATGSNNDLYVKYSTSGNTTTVLAMYVKISGAWILVPFGSGGGSTVTITPALQSGTKVADYSIDGTSGSLYAPPSGSTVTITPSLATGTKVADYSIDGVSGSLYAPNGGGGSSALADLTDVSITDPTEGQTLKYKPIANIETASGSVANFTTVVAYPIIECIAQIVPTQSGSGDASPSNIRLINVVSTVTISHSGADTSDPVEIEIPLGQIVVGGELDVKRGVLKVTWVAADMGGLSWTKYTSYTYPFFSANLSSLGIVTATSGQINILCESYKPIGALTLGGASGFGNNAHNLEIAQQSSGSQIMIQDSNYSTADDFKTSVAGRKVAFILATPIEITLTPEEITTLAGVNNIWADTGDISVEYVESFSDSWENEDAGGGSGDVFVIIYNGATTPTTINHSISEIYTAVTSGLAILFVDIVTTPKCFVLTDSSVVDSSNYTLSFGCPRKGYIDVTTLDVIDGTWDVTPYESIKYPLIWENSATLTAGQTSLTFTNNTIGTNNATYDVYTDNYGVNPTSMSINSHTLTLTFEAQQNDLNVKVRVTKP